MIILGTNSIKDTGYDVANSLRFNSGSSDDLTKTFSAGNRTTWTYSFWIKRNGDTSHNTTGVYTDGNNRDLIVFTSDGKFQWYSYQSGAYAGRLQTNRLFRDSSAWYHVVLKWDTSNGTADNRMQIYINGVQETSFAARVNPSSGATSLINSNIALTIGQSSGSYLSGYMSEVCFIDGTALDADSFGEFDEDSGIWKPISVSGLTFGTNGFYLDFENSGALGNDAAGSNNFTANNLTAIDQSTDTCTNNFCTINVLDNEAGEITISEGNLNYTTSGNDETNRCTFGFTKGKWYFESKYTDTSNYIDVGVGSASDSDIATPRFHMEMAGYYMLQSFTSYTKVWDNGSLIATLAASAENDIHMYAIDMDNNRFYAGKNGSWYSSGDPANNSNPLISMDNGYTTLMPSVCTKGDGAASLNFGSPSYSESGGETDGDGYGNFAHAVPSGYYAINTKNLAEYG